MNNFYPRSPCGERPPRARLTPVLSRFLSTLSLRRATTSVLPTIPAPTISIHALLAESDTYPSQCRTLARDFYPRSPCGERLLPVRQAWQPKIFLSTLSLRRATGAQQTTVTSQSISIHALLAESDLFLRSGPMTRRYFYPRSPCGERLLAYCTKF